MKTALKRNLSFLAIISITVSALIGLSSVLNIISFRNTYLEATAASNAIVADGTVNKIEYTLRYGRNLDNYYGIDDLFEELQSLYGYLGSVYITGTNGDILYKEVFSGAEFSPPQELNEHLQSILAAGGTQAWLEEDTQQLLLPIRDKAGQTIAGLGFGYPTSAVGNDIREYTHSAVLYTLAAIAVGIVLLVGLFFLVRHRFQFSRLLTIVIFVVIIANVFFGINISNVFTSGYMAMTRQMSGIYHQKIQNDVEGVINSGIAYAELEGMDLYFEDMVAATQEIEHISMGLQVGASQSAYVNIYEFPPDDTGAKSYLQIEVSRTYVESKIKGILVEIAVSIVTALMIAAEVIIFILAIFTGGGKVSRLRAQTIHKEKNVSYQPYGVVRGLAFFFSMFRYMAMAFVSLVIIEIYRPIYIGNHQIPYALVISLPLTAQMFSSMLGAYLSGKLCGRAGWKPAACLGILLMALGSLLCGLVHSPVPFIGCQLIFGLGLGISKTAVDLYSVVVASDGQMETYTSNANAATVVGLSCASAIGAIIASALGYSGAYLVMACVGVFVAALMLFFGQNIVVEEAKETKKEKPPSSLQKRARPFDLQFALYIVFLVVPYYFSIMFVDYLFPVFANEKGMPTVTIGYIFLAYGIATSYVGTFLCRVLSKKIRTLALMFIILVALGAGLGAFALYGNLVLAIGFVLFIALCDGIMPSLQFKFLYTLPITGRIGFSRTLGIEGFFSGAISAGAPVVFSLMMVNEKFMAAAAVILVCALVFRFGSPKAQQAAEKRSKHAT
ncbi:MAG: MFS transporter [Oscillospiraceae bacterium]